MKRHLALVALGAAALLLSCSRGGREVSPQPAGQTAATGQFRLSGPYTHENLTVFLVHGPDRLPGKTYLTLQEALQNKQAVVHETGNVNELTVENLSVDADVFILAGDIVCGGKQDRVISIDLILPPKSGKVKMGVYCVEAGRWTRRGDEPAGYFGVSPYQIAGNDMKLAAQYHASQSGVWTAVSRNQAELADSLKADVTNPESESSFALTLDAPAVKTSAKAYADALSKVVDGKPDVVGAVFVVNGKIRSADIYGCKALFLKLWPKNLNASAVDGLALRQKDAKFELPTAAQVQAFLVSAEDGQASEKEVSPRVRCVTHDAQATVQFRTFDRERAAAGWVHQSSIAKDVAPEPPAPPR